jgi:hypothetical protein
MISSDVTGTADKGTAVPMSFAFVAFHMLNHLLLPLLCYFLTVLFPLAAA